MCGADGEQRRLDVHYGRRLQPRGHVRLVQMMYRSTVGP
jgi:hypothetical protein